jgi:cytochrome b involved in lipid metabolism
VNSTADLESTNPNHRFVQSRRAVSALGNDSLFLLRPLRRAMKSFTAEEVAKHTKEEDLWTVINGDVYVSRRCSFQLVAEELTFFLPQDLSRFVDMHPGGSGVLLASGIAGGDSTEAFFSLHRSEVSGCRSRRSSTIG